MSYFALKFREILDRRDLSQSDIASLTGLSTAHISNLIKDVQPRISLDDLALVAANISDDKHERAELIRAHLLDENVGDGSELIEILISGGRSKASSLHDRPSRPPMAPHKERALEVFRNYEHHAHLWDVLGPLADMMEGEPINSDSDPAVQTVEEKIVAAVREEVSYRKPMKKKSSK